MKKISPQVRQSLLEKANKRIDPRIVIVIDWDDMIRRIEKYMKFARLNDVHGLECSCLAIQTDINQDHLKDMGESPLLYNVLIMPYSNESKVYIGSCLIKSLSSQTFSYAEWGDTDLPYFNDISWLDAVIDFDGRVKFVGVMVTDPMNVDKEHEILEQAGKLAKQLNLHTNVNSKKFKIFIKELYYRFSS